MTTSLRKNKICVNVIVLFILLFDFEHLQVVVATYDLNLRELQFVSDHLTELECRKLSEALTMEDYMLEHPVTGAHEKDVSCITLLLTWDRSDNGRARSFHRLSRRLTQIGRRDLADKLAQMVYDEKSDEVEEVLKDPFKKSIPTNSKLLAYGPESAKGNDEMESPGLTPLERAGVLGGCVTLVVVLLYCIRRYTKWRPCSNFVPNLKSFAVYHAKRDKKSKKIETDASGQKATKAAATSLVPAGPPPDDLTLLSTAV